LTTPKLPFSEIPFHEIRGVNMATPYLGEISYVAFNFAPYGWAVCNGQLLSISQNDALFALLGTIYGGDGVSTFGLPNLQSRVAIHWGTSLQGNNYSIGEYAGVENVTVLASQVAGHSHPIGAVSGNGNTSSPSGAVFAASSEDQYVAVASATGALGNVVIPNSGNQPHTNIQPYLTVTCVIALEGIFPQRG
jgi:microcystin-dependent protein